MNGRWCVILLLGLTLAACSDPGDAIPPALAELHQRAVAGDASAQLELGLHYVTGTGIPPDESAALRWIGKTAAQGNTAAQFELGSYYTLEPDRDFERAAEQGERDALDGQPGLQAELSDVELQQAWQRAQQYRQGPW